MAGLLWFAVGLVTGGIVGGGAIAIIIGGSRR